MQRAEDQQRAPAVRRKACRRAAPSHTAEPHSIPGSPYSATNSPKTAPRDRTVWKWATTNYVSCRIRSSAAELSTRPVKSLVKHTRKARNDHTAELPGAARDPLKLAS